MNKTTHLLSDEWSIGDQVFHLHIQDLMEYIKLRGLEPIEIAHEEIAHKQLPLTTTQRYIAADVKYPGIVSEGMVNPLNRPYRLLDGRHRIRKLNEQGVYTSYFYNVPPSICCKLLKSER